MFYKDEKGIDICQLGTGDISVSELEYPDISPKEVVGIAFGETKKAEIGKIIPNSKGKYDYEFNVKFKLLFTKVESIDIVIEALEKSKRLMEVNQSNQEK